MNLNGVVDRLIIQAFETAVGIGESIFVEGLIVLDDFYGSLVGNGIDDELCIVLTAHLGCVGSMETRAGHANKGIDRLDTRVGIKHATKAINDSLRLLERGTFRQVNLDGKTITLGFRQQFKVETGKEEHTQYHRNNSRNERAPRVTEAKVKQLLIAVLQGLEEGLLGAFNQGRFMGREFGFNSRVCHKWDDPNGIYNTTGQGDKDSPGEELDKVGHRTRDEFEHRKEHTRDRGRSYEHGNEEFRGADCGGIPARMPLVEEVGIAVDDYHTIVHHHT